MRVGLVRNVALGLVALVGLGLVGCDDKPTDFGSSDTVRITTNPSTMTVPAGVTTLLETRTENQGAEPTWEEITASVDGSCGAGAIVVAEAASYEPSLQPPGQFDITGGNTWGVTCIQLSGGGADATVDVMVVADSLELTNTPPDDELIVFQQVQLGANLLADDGSAVGPFDPTTDITWTSDDGDVLSVDDTGLVTAEGAGSATITATWSEFGVDVTAETTITVVVPPPVLTSTDAASADALQLITITGTGFIPGAHAVLLNGLEPDAFYEATVVNSTTATVLMPGGPAEDIDITVGVAGGESNALTVSRTCGASDETCATEPGNESGAGAPDVGALPVSFAGFVDGADPNDVLAFSLAAETTFTLNLDWTGNSGDLDLVFNTTGEANYNEGACGYPAATGAQPETGECTLPAGDYFVWVTSYDQELAFYQLDLVEVP